MIYKIVYVIIHFVIVIVSYLVLIRLLFVELGFRQIKIKHILYYTTIRLQRILRGLPTHIGYR